MRAELREQIRGAYNKAQGSWTDCDWFEPEPSEEFLRQVEKDAKAAEEAAELAMDALCEGDLILARLYIREAASRESEYGDDPTWGALKRLIEQAYEEAT